MSRNFASAPPRVENMKNKRCSAPLPANRTPSSPTTQSSEASDLLLALRVLAIDVEHVRRSFGRVQHSCDGVGSRLRTARKTISGVAHRKKDYSDYGDERSISAIILFSVYQGRGLWTHMLSNGNSFNNILGPPASSEAFAPMVLPCLMGTCCRCGLVTRRLAAPLPARRALLPALTADTTSSVSFLLPLPRCSGEIHQEGQLEVLIDVVLNRDAPLLHRHNELRPCS